MVKKGGWQNVKNGKTTFWILLTIGLYLYYIVLNNCLNFQKNSLVHSLVNIWKPSGDVWMDRWTLNFMKGIT